MKNFKEIKEDLYNNMLDQYTDLCNTHAVDFNLVLSAAKSMYNAFDKLDNGVDVNTIQSEFLPELKQFLTECECESE